MAEENIRPGGVNPADAQRVLEFLNAAQTAEEIADAVEIPGERDVGIGVAQRILERRRELGGRFTTLQQVYDVPQVGPERFTEIVTTISRREDTMTQMREFPPGGLTPVFNEVTILLAISPDRPAPEAGIDDIYGPTERVVMQNQIDETTGLVLPTIFSRSETFGDQNTGLRTQLLTIAVDSGITTSRIFGGELTMYVRPPFETPTAARAGLPPEALEASQVPWDAVVPSKPSVGSIQALSPGSDFPARISIPVYYSFVSGGRDGKLANKATNFSVEAKEPHIMEGVVTSVPPDPETCIGAKEWNLIEESGFLKLWIKVECFRFLGIGDWEHKERLTYRNGQVVPASQ